MQDSGNLIVVDNSLQRRIRGVIGSSKSSSKLKMKKPKLKSNNDLPQITD